MALSDDVKKWVDWQNDQFMIVDVHYFSAQEAEEYMQEGDEYSGADREYTAGFYGRLSAPGYMDCTDWEGPYATEDDAIQALYDVHGNDMPID